MDFVTANTFPKSITHINLILISKKDIVQFFSNLRSICLSNFVNKILLRILYDRLENIFPRLLSHNQSGFVRERNIVENVLLTQEVITDIGKKGKHSNVVIKLGMVKAYNRVFGYFFMKFLRKMSFSNKVVDIIWRFISNNYYLILLIGQSVGFYHFTRG